MFLMKFREWARVFFHHFAEPDVMPCTNNSIFFARAFGLGSAEI